MKRGKRRSDYRRLDVGVFPTMGAPVVCGDIETTRVRCIARGVG